MVSTNRTRGIARVVVPLLAALAVVLAFVLPARLEAHDSHSGQGQSGQGSDDVEHEANKADDDDHEADEADDDDHEADDGDEGEEADDDGGPVGRKDRHGGAAPGSGQPQAVGQAPPPPAAPPAAAPTAAPPPAPPAARGRRRGHRPRQQRDGGRVHLPRARPPVNAPPTVAPGGGEPAALPGRLADPSAGAPRRAAASEHPRTRRARGARRPAARPEASVTPPAPTAPSGRRRGPNAAVGLALTEPTSGRPVAGVEPLLLALAGAGFLLAAAMLRPGRRGRAR